MLMTATSEAVGMPSVPAMMTMASAQSATLDGLQEPLQHGVHLLGAGEELFDGFHEDLDRDQADQEDDDRGDDDLAAGKPERFEELVKHMGSTSDFLIDFIIAQVFPE